jgi:hypothetical protein
MSQPQSSASKEQKPWKRFVLFAIIFGYAARFGAKLAWWDGFGCGDFVILAIGGGMVWFLVCDLSNIEVPDKPKRGGWRRRYHFHHTPE